jgi:hypothetical protein
MTDKEQLFEFLYGICQEDNDFLADTLRNYLDAVSEEGLTELEDLLVNNFGDN